MFLLPFYSGEISSKLENMEASQNSESSMLEVNMMQKRAERDALQLEVIVLIKKKKLTFS